MVLYISFSYQCAHLYGWFCSVFKFCVLIHIGSGICLHGVEREHKPGNERVDNNLIHVVWRWDRTPQLLAANCEYQRVKPVTGC